MPAKSVAQAKYFRWLEHAPDAAAERKKSGMSHEQMHDFAVTKNAGLPQRVKHLANGRPPMTNTAFQQNERVSGARPVWMESAVKSHAAGKPAPNKSGGGHWLASAEVDTPKYRVKKTAVGHMADGKKPEKWAAEAFGKNKGGLHRATNTPRGEKIPESKIQTALHSKNLHVKRMALAAHNI